ncbi:MAG TPA: DUF4232 domain-containing protein [Candidatus Dormibacteraeota bacterium]|nr:DUF4232 domain-containing protein [Candidatus Dormibacteraeota bacterium]
MGRRLLVALPMALLVTGCGGPAATVSPAPAATGDAAIPWIDTKPPAYHQGLAVPVGEALPGACTGSDLTATYGGAMGLTNGQLTGTVDLANTSSTPCLLEGIATVDLFGAKGATLSTSVYTNTRFTATAVVLHPVAGLSSESVSSGHALVEIDWSIYDDAGAGTCTGGLAQAAAIGITVPGGGTVATSAVSPRGDGPLTFCPPRIGVGAFQPSTPPTASASPEPGAQYFEATLNVPPTAVVGHALNYQVTLKSVYSRPLTFPNGCPAYAQDLGGPGGWSLGKTWYVFNCQPMGAVVAPGTSFTFAMVVQIPASAPVGDYSLAWGMDVGDSNNRAVTANFRVTAH